MGQGWRIVEAEVCTEPVEDAGARGFVGHG